MKIISINRKNTIHIITNTNNSLLSIKYFQSSVRILRPINRIERKTIFHRTNNFVSFFIFVDKFSLIFWTNIEPTIITKYSFFLIIDISSEHISHEDLVQINFHKKKSKKIRKITNYFRRVLIPRVSNTCEPLKTILA